MAAEDNVYRSVPSLAPTVLATAALLLMRSMAATDAPARQKSGEYPRPRAATCQPVSTCSPRTP